MKKILIVDDELTVCEMLKKFLSMRGYEAMCAYSGEEAVTKIKGERPDAVLLDIIMPDMNGLEVLEKIREMDPDLPVIMVTAVKDAEAGRECLKLGARDYITKPFSLEYLDNVLKSKLLTIL